MCISCPCVCGCVAHGTPTLARVCLDSDVPLPLSVPSGWCSAFPISFFPSFCFAFDVVLFVDFSDKYFTLIVLCSWLLRRKWHLCVYRWKNLLISLWLLIAGYLIESLFVCANVPKLRVEFCRIQSPEETSLTWFWSWHGRNTKKWVAVRWNGAAAASREEHKIVSGSLLSVHVCVCVSALARLQLRKTRVLSLNSRSDGGPSLFLLVML